jgi:Glutamine synthetase
VVTTDLYHDVKKQQDKVPNSLFAALKALDEDSWLTEHVGKELVDVFTSLKRKEIEEYKKYVTDWEWDTYSYHI